MSNIGQERQGVHRGPEVSHRTTGRVGKCVEVHEPYLLAAASHTEVGGKIIMCCILYT